MSAGLEVKDLELKELFMKQDIERMIELLDGMAAQDVVEMININWNVVKKYYDLNRSDLLRQHLSFVAYTSFITEYAGKASLYDEEEYALKFQLFELVFEKLQSE